MSECGMSLYSPIFDRRGVLVAWLLDNNFVISLEGKSMASVHSDGAVLSTDLAVHLGGFENDLFRDVDSMPVAFVDRSLQRSQPDSPEMFSPALARLIPMWSPISWIDFLDNGIR